MIAVSDATSPPHPHSYRSSPLAGWLLLTCKLDHAKRGNTCRDCLHEGSGCCWTSVSFATALMCDISKIIYPLHISLGRNRLALACSGSWESYSFQAGHYVIVMGRCRTPGSLLVAMRRRATQLCLSLVTGIIQRGSFLYPSQCNDGKVQPSLLGLDFQVDSKEQEPKSNVDLKLLRLPLEITGRRTYLQHQRIASIFSLLFAVSQIQTSWFLSCNAAFDYLVPKALDLFLLLSLAKYLLLLMAQLLKYHIPVVWLWASPSYCSDNMEPFSSLTVSLQSLTILAGVKHVSIWESFQGWDFDSCAHVGKNPDILHWVEIADS